MTQTRQRKKSSRRRYSTEFKSEALRLADSVGVSAAAEQLGLHGSQLYAWRSKAQLLKARGEIDQELADENARLKRQLAEKEQELVLLGKAAAYFAKRLK
jgi:transposase